MSIDANGGAPGVDWAGAIAALSDLPSDRLTEALGVLIPESVARIDEVWLIDRQSRTARGLNSGRLLEVSTSETMSVDWLDNGAVRLPASWQGRVLGSIELVPAPTTTEADLRALGTLVGVALLAGFDANDVLHQRRREQAMALPAELQWSLLPEPDYSDALFSISAAVEPAYETGGDVYDYAVAGTTVRMSVLDAMGHGLRAALCSALAVASVRRARREGESLRTIAEATHDALREQYGDSAFVTAVLAEVDLEARQLRWLNAGHPRPLLWRDGSLEELVSEPVIPLGMDVGTDRPEMVASSIALQPGDVVCLYTDGMVDNLGIAGEPYGTDRFFSALSDRLAATADRGLIVARDAISDLTEYSDGDLRDDATLILCSVRGD